MELHLLVQEVGVRNGSNRHLESLHDRPSLEMLKKVQLLNAAEHPCSLFSYFLCVPRLTFTVKYLAYTHRAASVTVSSNVLHIRT